MGRGSKPAKSKEAKPSACKSPKDDDSRIRDLEKRLADSLAEQRAMAEILRTISGGPTDRPLPIRLPEYCVDRLARQCRHLHPSYSRAPKSPGDTRAACSRSDLAGSASGRCGPTSAETMNSRSESARRRRPVLPGPSRSSQ